MKKFIYKTLSFLSVILIAVIAVYLADNIFINSSITSSKLIMGDSHTETSVDDSTIPNTQNISQSSETYFFSYQKLNKILDHHKIDTLILSFSPHNISVYNDLKVNGKDTLKRYQELYPRYYRALNSDGWGYLKSKSKIDLLEYLTPSIKTNIESFFKLKPSYIGNFKKSNKSNLSDSLINRKIKIQFYNKNEIFSVSEEQLKYLYLIKDICKENNIKLYLIDIPVHPKYKSKIPKTFKESFAKISTNLETDGFEILNFKNLKFNDTHFGDGDHLNYNGSKILTEALNNKLYFEKQ